MPNDIVVTASGIEPTRAYLGRVRSAAQARTLLGRMRFAVLMVHRHLMGLSRGRPPIGQQGVLPVITGRLKNSFFSQVRRQGRSVLGIEGSNLEYAYPVEQRRRFLARTVRDMRQPVNDIFAQPIQRAVDRGGNR